MSIIQNPVVPYVGGIHGVAPGWIIHVQGIPNQNAKWFGVNLQCGPSMNPRDDIALHINPRFEGNMSRVIRNSLQAQQWGLEENFGHFPFAPSQPFDLLILVEHNVFKIAVNGLHFTDFNHRMDLNRIHTLTVDGDVILQQIRFEGGTAGFPPEVMQQQSTTQLGAPPPGGAYNRSPSPQPQYGGATSGYPQQGHKAVPGYPQQQAYGQHLPNQNPYGSGNTYPQTSAYPTATPSYPQNPSSGYPPQTSQQGYSGYASGYPGASAPMPIPSHSPGSSRKHDYMKMAGVGIGGAVAGAVISRLVYPGHGGRHGGHGMMGYGGHGGHHGYGGPGMMGGMMGHGMMGKKGMKKMKKFKHKHHKPKMHKFKHKGKWGSSSSSSSEESE